MNCQDKDKVKCQQKIKELGKVNACKVKMMQDMCMESCELCGCKNDLPADICSGDVCKTSLRDKCKKFCGLCGSPAKPGVAITTMPVSKATTVATTTTATARPGVAITTMPVSKATTVATTTMPVSKATTVATATTIPGVALTTVPVSKVATTPTPASSGMGLNITNVKLPLPNNNVSNACNDIYGSDVCNTTVCGMPHLAKLCPKTCGKCNMMGGIKMENLKLKCTCSN
jgi:hypothetical protein